MKYWLDLFTGTTWEEFRNSGAAISGFSERMRKSVERITPGDVLLCYITGIKRWVGALEVLGPSNDKSRIWEIAEFPARLRVKPLVILSAENGVPMDDLLGKVSFFRSPAERGKYNGFLRMSPNRFQSDEDAICIIEMLRCAKVAPVSRPVDAKLFARKPFFTTERRKGKETISTIVSIPDSEEEENAASFATTRHTEIQFELLALGAEMKFDVWVARNDRSRMWNNRKFGEMPRVIAELPTQFNEETNRAFELIDVLWLKGKSIAAAFGH
jgi:hypothetical protein